MEWQFEMPRTGFGYERVLMRATWNNLGITLHFHYMSGSESVPLFEEFIAWDKIRSDAKHVMERWNHYYGIGA